MIVEVVPGLHRLLRGSGVNAYIWHPHGGQPGDGEPVIFDCGFPWSGRSLAAGLAAIGCRPQDIGTIAITHFDFDHVGRLRSLQAVSGAAVAAHELEAPRIQGQCWREIPGNRGPTAEKLVRGAARLALRVVSWQPVHVSRAVLDGAQLPGGWVAVHTPGHTPGHVSYFHPAQRLLIAGDAIGSPRRGQVRGASPTVSEDLPACVRSVQRLADLAPDVICFGHGPELYDAAGPLQRLAASLTSQGAAGEVQHAHR